MKKSIVLGLVFPISVALMSLASCALIPTEKTPDVETVSLKSIEITHAANKTLYKIGESVSYEGLEVTAHFNGYADQVIPHKELEFSGFDSSTAGKKTINIAFTFEKVTKETSYKVTVTRDDGEEDEDVVLDFYAFSDTHGNVLDSSLGVGIAKTSTFIKDKIQGQNSLLISSGDMFQGTLESNVNRGELMTSWMESLNFTSMTLGNHEFDWGKNVIKDIKNNHNLPILGINIIDKNTGERADYADASTIVTRGGAKIGIIGAIGDCYGSVSYSQVMDVEFVVDKEGPSEKPLTQLIKQESNRLRNEENCDFIVYSVHGDSKRNTYYNTELSTGGYVDVVLEGHSHVEEHYQDSGNVWHFEEQADGALAINHFRVNLNVATDEYTVSFNQYNDVYWMNSNEKYYLAEDAEALALINSYDFSQYYESLGINSVDRSGYEMRQLCAQLYYENAKAKRTEYADKIVLGGGYISIRGEGYLPAGPVTYSKLYSLFPFDNDVMLMQVNGSVLKDNYLNSTNSNYFLCYSEYGANLRDNQYLINDNEMYYVVSDTYTYDYLYKRNMGPVKVEALRPNGCFARELMAEYAQKGGFDDSVIPDPDPDDDEILHAGTLEDPYTVSDALIEAAKHSSIDEAPFVYCTGEVVSVGSFSPSYGDLGSVVIKDPTNEAQIFIYYLHRYNGAPANDNFNSINDLNPGDTLLIHGQPFCYGATNTLEFGYTTYCVSINGVEQGPSN